MFEKGNADSIIYQNWKYSAQKSILDIWHGTSLKCLLSHINLYILTLISTYTIKQNGGKIILIMLFIEHQGSIWNQSKFSLYTVLIL